MKTFWYFLKREFQIIFRNTSTIIQPLIFFVIIALMFPFSLPADLNLLSKLGGGVIWVSAVLATLLSLDAIFKGDYEDGTLQQIVIHTDHLELAVLGKVAAHWVASGLTLSLLSPLLCIAFNIPTNQIWVLFAGLILGSPSLSLIGAIGAALTVSLKRGGVIIAVIILPLFTPIIIFGAGMLSQLSQGLPIISEMYALAAIFVLCLSLAPFAIATALRTTID